MELKVKKPYPTLQRWARWPSKCFQHSQRFRGKWNAIKPRETSCELMNQIKLKASGTVIELTDRTLQVASEHILHNGV